VSKEKVKAEDLSNAVMEYLNNYAEDIHDDVVETTEDCTKRAIEELKEVSQSKFKTHVKSKPYWRGWDSKIQLKGKLKYHRVIWNKTNYQLTHLLENGHHTRNGGWVDGKPHIEPIEQKYNQEFVDLLTKRIREGKK